MKKIKGIIIGLVLTISFALIKNVNAVKLTQQEYESFNIKRAYVIGDYIFDLSHHNPTLWDFMRAISNSNTSNVEIIEISITENLFGDIEKKYTSLENNETLEAFPELDVKYIYRSAININEELEDKTVLTEKSEILYGDVNGDGVLNSQDMTILRRYLAEGYGVTINSAASDVNLDGSIDDVDLVLLRNKIATSGIILPYETGEKYSIEYNLDGGEISERNYTTYASITLPYTLTNPTKEGYVFIGWTGSNGEEPELEVTIGKGTTGNLTYTANWIIDEEEYTITYNLNGGVASNPEEYTEASETFTLTNPTKEGYAFIGWTGSNGEEPEIEVTIEKGTTGNLTYTANYVLYGDVNGDNTLNAKDTTLLRRYLAGGYGVTTNSIASDINQDGILNSKDITLLRRYLAGGYGVTIPYVSEVGYDYQVDYVLGYVSGEEKRITEYFYFGELDKIKNPTREGYTFAGWTYNGEPYELENYESKADCPLSTTELNELEANWIIDEEEYTITYNLNGGVASNPEEYTEASETFTLNNPTKEGYAFIGWTGSNGEEPEIEVTIEKGTTGNLTYTANWAKYGDVNEDGKINNQDSIAISKYLAGWEVEITEQGLKNADVNGDGQVNSVDSILLARFNADWYPNTLPNIPITDYVLYGDVNEDGKINNKDFQRLGQYLAGWEVEITEQGLKNADVNGDGQINGVDSILLARFNADWYPNTLPNEPITDYILYGDVNEDGEVNAMDKTVLNRYLANQSELTEQGLKNADVNGDGQINGVDSILLARFNADWTGYQNTLPNKPITDYVLYGDANEDGKINNQDSIAISQHLGGQIILTEQGLKNADVNEDGEVTDFDATLILRFVANYYPDTLPNEPILVNE